MAEALSPKSPAMTFRLSFYFWMLLVMNGLVFGGFSLTYWMPMAGGSLASLPPVVHIHGFIFSGWMLLLLVQASLVGIGNVPLHRSLGNLGIAWGAVIMVFAALLTILPSDLKGAPPTGDYFTLEYLSMASVVLFGGLFGFAIANVRHPQVHKRLILLSIIPLLPPGINRLYMVLLDTISVPLIPTYLTMDALVAAIALHDWKTTGKISRATQFGGGIIVLSHLLHVPIIRTETFADFCEFLGSLARYR